MKILIVDDEARARKALARCVQSLYPSDTVLEAANGQDALHMVEKDGDDIAITITDIRMPRMDGIAFIQRAREEGYEGIFVVLSAFSEFEYAQQALRYGAVDYLLKPALPKDIAQTLTHAKALLDERHRQKEISDKREGTLKKTLPAYLHSLMYRWVSGEATGEEIGEVASFFPENTGGYLLLWRLPESWSPKERESYRYEIREMLRPIGRSLSFLPPTESLIMGTAIAADGALTPEALASQLHMANGTKVVLGAYIEALIADAAPNWQTLVTASGAWFYGDTPDVLMAPYTFAPIKAEGMDEAEAFSQCVRERNVDKASQWLKACVMDMASAKPAPKSLISYTRTLLIGAQTHLNKMGLLKQGEQTMDALFAQDEPTSLDRLIKQAQMFLEMLLMEVKTVEPRASAAVMEEVKGYIHKCLGEALSLESVANHFHYSPAYLSRTFRVFANQTFSEFLIEARIQRAAELLMKTHLRIYQIANEVGYTDVQYFHRVFRRAMGLTPDEYRRIRQG